MYFDPFFRARREQTYLDQMKTICFLGSEFRIKFPRKIEDLNDKQDIFLPIPFLLKKTSFLFYASSLKDLIYVLQGRKKEIQ